MQVSRKSRPTGFSVQSSTGYLIWSAPRPGTLTPWLQCAAPTTARSSRRGRSRARLAPHRMGRLAQQIACWAIVPARTPPSSRCECRSNDRGAAVTPLHRRQASVPSLSWLRNAGQTGVLGPVQVVAAQAARAFLSHRWRPVGFAACTGVALPGGPRRCQRRTSGPQPTPPAATGPVG